MATQPPKGFFIRRQLGKLWLRLHGWTLDDRVPEVRKAILVAAPHTSNWDLTYALAIAWVQGMRLQWVAKHTLFRPPFGWLLKLLGGIPVNRQTSHNLVDALVSILNQHDQLMLLIAPSGTRKRASRWKTGFYWTAVGAKVPVVLGFLDYANKRGGLGEVFTPTGDIRKDFETIRAFYAPIRGKHPEYESEVSLGPEDAKKNA